MVKTLRRKFIIITMISVTSVFLLILATINIVNYSNVMKNANLRLSLLAENGGSFEDMQGKPGAVPDKPNGEDTASPSNIMQKKSLKPNDTKSSLTRNLELHDSSINEETPFETRYYTVTLDRSGNYIESNTDNIVAVSEDEAIANAIALFSEERVSGRLNDYMYTRIDTASGDIMYIFLNSTRELSSFRSFLIISIAIAILGILLVFILANILSRIVLRPVFASYDKQKRFITDASHELKTPVAIIDADVEIIEMESGESEWTKSISKQTSRLSRLTEQMVFLSRMDEGSAGKELTELNASDIFREVSESFEPIALKQNKSLHIDIEPNIIIKGDENNLTQMLSLLIDNAFKYSNAQGTVDITFRRSSKGKVLVVYNTVESIDKGSHDELFDRFYRRDQSRNSKTGGFGIGLSVVQAIALSHRAKISAYSADTKSIEFRIIF